MKFRYSLMRYAEKYGVARASRKYNKAKSYIYFWKARFDGSIESLACRSRRPHRHPRHLGQVHGVKAAMVGLAVGSHQPRPVHAQHHMEMIQRHIVQQHIISPLQKAGIHRKHRHHALLGHTGAHGHRMALGDPRQ